MTALAPDQRSAVHSKYPAVFRCTLVEDKLPVPGPVSGPSAGAVVGRPVQQPVTETKPEIVTVTQTETENNTSIATNGVSDQQASADHYNQLDRSKVRDCIWCPQF